jgi:hypothetical protein
MEDDNVSMIALTVEDFGVNHVMGFVKGVSSSKTPTAPRFHMPKACSPYHQQPHQPWLSPPPAPASTLPQLGCIFAILLLLVGHSWSGATLGSTASLTGVLGPVIQGLGSLCSGPSSPNPGSVLSAMPAWLVPCPAAVLAEFNAPPAPTAPLLAWTADAPATWS